MIRFFKIISLKLSLPLLSYQKGNIVEENEVILIMSSINIVKINDSLMKHPIVKETKYLTITQKWMNLNPKYA